MILLYLSQPIILFYDQKEEDLMIFFTAHTRCSCGRERIKQIVMPMNKRPVLVCVACQERYIVEFPVH